MREGVRETLTKRQREEGERREKNKGRDRKIETQKQRWK